jgi:hypothetical protein
MSREEVQMIRETLIEDCHELLEGSLSIAALNRLESERDRYQKALEDWKRMMANDAYDMGELISEFDQIVSNTLSA